MQANPIQKLSLRIATSIDIYEANMTTISLEKKHLEEPPSKIEKVKNFGMLIKESWEVIAPFWPLENLIAVNPLQGFENLAIEEAFLHGSAYFQQSDIPKPMEAVNRETIKWLQAYFDKGQSIIAMPLRSSGLYSSWKQLVVYDKRLHQNQPEKINWLKSLPDSPKQALAQCLVLLKIPKEETAQFLRVLLISMSGWASYIKYKSEWMEPKNKDTQLILETDYLAIRAVITYLIWPESVELIAWSQQALAEVKNRETPLKKIEQFEENYRFSLLNQLKEQKLRKPCTPSAQLVFCIDVRSEQFRRSLEATGEYETFGFAGFFGIPSRITDVITGESYASCPVLLSPKHEVKEHPCGTKKEYKRNLNGYKSLYTIKRIYQSVKYTFTTPFAMVEGLGVIAGLWISLRTLTPSLAFKLKKSITNLIRKPVPTVPHIDDISLEDQCAYAEGALKMMGLTHHFAPLIVFCGHGSSTENNAYASALDCGACGGRHGSSNARILAYILNRSEVRNYLIKRGISIPEKTLFIGAKHNTTTDEVTLCDADVLNDTIKLKKDLKKAQKLSSAARLQKMSKTPFSKSKSDPVLRRSHDWAQVRPEWGLAKNAAFIVAPRDLTKTLNLEGRCFLHSYDYVQDTDGKLLETILTAPMVVAQWINTQYLFSTLDNVSYGGGSKVTKNIAGKIGIMQGNASDLMTGLPLQSVYSSDVECYHEPQRLMTVVYAPLSRLNAIIRSQSVLQKLFGNGWVQLVCIEPKSRETHCLQRDLTWEKMH